MENAYLYKEITLDIKKCVENDNVENLQELFQKRQDILIQEQNNENFKKDLIDLGIVEMDKELKILIEEKMKDVKLQIRKQKAMSTASINYMKANKPNLNLFNTTI
jgi:hypothetical protein